MCRCARHKLYARVKFLPVLGVGVIFSLRACKVSAAYP